MQGLFNLKYTQMKEQIYPNGLGLAKVSKKLDEKSMVILELNHWRDLSTNHDYNHEYVIMNNLTMQEYSTDSYYDGGNIKKDSIEKFNREVNYNDKLIERVKNHLGIGD